MKEAISLYFDGAIQAQHCNYLSYRDFGLCCPESGSPVFLASGDIQQPHFRHFRDREPKDCKYRVGWHQPEDKQPSLDRIDHTQRERIFRQHFWAILNAVVPQLALEEMQAELKIWKWDFHSAWIEGWQAAVQMRAWLKSR